MGQTSAVPSLMSKHCPMTDKTLISELNSYLKLDPVDELRRSWSLRQGLLSHLCLLLLTSWNLRSGEMEEDIHSLCSVCPLPYLQSYHWLLHFHTNDPSLPSMPWFLSKCADSCNSLISKIIQPLEIRQTDSWYPCKLKWLSCFVNPPEGQLTLGESDFAVLLFTIDQCQLCKDSWQKTCKLKIILTDRRKWFLSKIQDNSNFIVL